MIAHTRFAVTLLFIALAFGIVLEMLHGFKAVAPVGAALILYAIGAVALALWKR